MQLLGVAAGVPPAPSTTRGPVGTEARRHGETAATKVNLPGSKPPISMKSFTPNPALAAAALLLSGFTSASAQTVAPRTTGTSSSDTVELSPFVITETSETGWVATETLAGTRSFDVGRVGIARRIGELVMHPVHRAPPEYGPRSRKRPGNAQVDRTARGSLERAVCEEPVIAGFEAEHRQQVQRDE